jgi:NAD(P)-dependent dehydrogenase (short-subunit alcohol dehydrogenase family)
MSMQNKIVAITGANAGLGKETALALAKQGAHIVMLCRNAEKAEAARQEIIHQTGNSNIEIIPCDLADLNSVRQAAAEFKRNHAHLHVLINNAGFMTLEQQSSRNGLEATFAVNYLAHVLLTLLLLDRLKASAPSRIINLTSRVHKMAKFDLDDLMMMKTPYKGLTAYANSKLAMILFTYHLAKQLEGSGVTVNAVDPGMVDTEFGDKVGIPAGMRIFTFFLRPWVKQPPEGALTSIKLASDPSLATTGTFWTKQKPAKSSPVSYDTTLQTRLQAKALVLLKSCLN